MTEFHHPQMFRRYRLRFRFFRWSIPLGTIKVRVR